MAVITIPKPLREKLGDEATEAFIEIIRTIDIESRKELTTKEDIVKLDGKIDKIKAELDGKLKHINWMLGILIAGVLSLVMKVFFI